MWQTKAQTRLDSLIQKHFPLDEEDKEFHFDFLYQGAMGDFTIGNLDDDPTFDLDEFKTMVRNRIKDL